MDEQLQAIHAIRNLFTAISQFIRIRTKITYCTIPNNSDSEEEDEEEEEEEERKDQVETSAELRFCNPVPRASFYFQISPALNSPFPMLL
jgi:hypothetical protein